MISKRGFSFPTPWRRFADAAFERRLVRMRDRPPNPAAVIRAGDKLIRRGRFEDADALLERAIARWPGRADLLHCHAMSAHDEGRFAVALERWRRVREVDEGLAMPWCAIAGDLRVLHQMAAAEETIRESLRRFPDHLGVACEAARILDRVGKQAEAAVQWRRLMDLKPVHRDWYQGYAYSLIQLGRFDEAQSVLDAAQARHPGDRDLLATRGLLEMGREDWNAALAIWRAYRARYPDDQTGWENQGKTIAAIHLARSEAENHDDDAVLVEIETVEDEATRSLLLGFESIGKDCEFGLVQRRFGAEPLGLLRFNNVALQNLMIALDAGFAGMGDPDLTTLSISGSGEYYVTDLRWDLGMHTFMFSSQYDAATLLPKMCRRVAYLRDKLIEDLRAAGKTFVFKGDTIDLDGLRALHRTLRAHGPVRLLHVRQASVPLFDEPLDIAPGQVFLLEPDLYLGFLGRMGNATPNWDIAFDEWVAICGALANAPPLPVGAPMSTAPT